MDADEAENFDDFVAVRRGVRTLWDVPSTVFCHLGHPTGDHRPGFDPRQFASSSDPLYLLPRESDASAGPSFAAVTVAVAVLEKAEMLATRSPGGRLPAPITVVLGWR